MTEIDKQKKPLLRFRFEGESIKEGRILYDDFSLFISNIRLAVERIINGIRTGESIKKGRPLKSVQILSALEIVSTGKGSFKLALDLRRQEEQFPGWDLGEQAVDILVDGLVSIEKGQELPKQYDQGVMIALRDAGRIIERGVEKVTINARRGEKTRTVYYHLPTREKIISKLLAFEKSYAVIEGRLLSVDAKEDKLRCRIEPSLGEPTMCRFDENMTEQVISMIRQFVQARGEAIYDVGTNKITSFVIRDLEPIEENMAQGNTATPLSSFWKGKSFEELTAEQAVYPIQNIDELTGDWPEDTDIDTYLTAVRSARE